LLTNSGRQKVSASIQDRIISAAATDQNTGVGARDLTIEDEQTSANERGKTMMTEDDRGGSERSSLVINSHLTQHQGSISDHLMPKYQPNRSDEHTIDSCGERRRSVDDILNFIGYGPLQFIAFCLAGLSAIAFGLDTAIFAFVDIPVQQEWNLTGIEYAILPATTGVTNIIGTFFFALLCDYYGRVWPYALILGHIGIFGLASAFSPSFTILVLFRDITSLAVTSASMVLFTTLVEFLPVRNRGKVMVSVFVIEAFGVCLTGGLAWWLIPTFGQKGWRYLIIATSIPNFLGVAYRLIFNIQSPRFLIAKGRYKEARRVFEKMAKLNGKKLNNFLPVNCRFEDVVQLDVEKKRSFMESVYTLLSMFKQPFLRTTFFTSIIFVTENGAYYASSIFLLSVLKDLGNNPYFTAFIGYLGQIPGILLMSIVTDWPSVGRLNSLRFFSFMSAISFGFFAGFRDQVATPILTILIYFSMVPMISLLYTYVSEVYPTEYRSFALGYYNNLASAFNICVPFLSGYLSDVRVHWVYPTAWAGMFLFQLIMSLFLNKETVDRNLKDRAE
jgi:putative MFS transporter